MRSATRRRLCVLATGLVLAIGAALLTPLGSAPAQAAASHKILITGDSITQGSSGDYTWRYRLWNKLASTAPGSVAFVGPRTDLFDNVNNRQGSQYYAASFGAKAHGALWGDSYRDELGNIAGQVRSSGANVLVVMLGSNDLAYLTSPAATIANLQTYISRARAAKPGLDIVVGEVPNRYDPWSGNYVITEQVNDYAARLATLASQLNTSNERVVVAPTRSGWDAKTMTWDGTHPNPSGEMVIAQRVSQGLAKLGIGTAGPDIIAPKSWDVSGPTVSLTPGSEQADLAWSRTSTGATGMFIEQRLENTLESWQRLQYAVSGNGWTAEMLAAGGTYQYRVVPVKGTSTGAYGPASTVTAGGPTPGDISSVRPGASSRSLYGGAAVNTTWTASSQASGYLLSYRMLSNGAMTWDDLPYAVTRRDWTFEPLVNGRRFQFRIRGSRGFLLGAWKASGARRTTGIPSGRTYVALGDSYSSGLGSSGEYESGCHRTVNAWAFGMQTPWQQRFALYACAGDTISGVRTQMGAMGQFFDSYPGQPQLITVTVGGNDVGFSDLLALCIMGTCSDEGIPGMAKMDALKPHLTDLYNDLQAAEPYADIMVGGYPWVIEPDAGVSTNIGCIRMNQNEKNMITGLSNYLNDTISAAARTAGVWDVGQRVRDAFINHNACQGGDDEWINALDRDFGGDISYLVSSKSFHPKDSGQLAYARAFSDALIAATE